MLYEKALQYANDVIDGTEKAPFEVKKQCEWFIRDLEMQNDEDYPYYFNLQFLSIVENIFKIMYFATGLGVVGLTIYEGLKPFQCFFIANVFGWRFKNNPEKYRYRESVLFIPRKNAKTFIVALIVIILMLTEPNYSEFYSICIDRELAGEVKKAIQQILDSSPYVAKYFNIPKTLRSKNECTLTHSFYQPRTAQANSNNSIKPSAFIADEIGAFKDAKNIKAMQSGQLNVNNPLTFKLTTAYAEDHSIMLDELVYLKKIYLELECDDRLFAMLYYAEEEHLWDEEGLYTSNPLRIEENYDEIRRNRKNALAKPSEREEYLTKNMNYFVPSNSGESYIDVRKVRLCKASTKIEWAGREAYIGLDLAMTTDNVAVSMVSLSDDGKLLVKSWAFIPAGRIEDKNRIERTDYNRFIREGGCFACGDEVVDYGYIEKFIMDIEEIYGVTIIQIGCDPYNAISTTNKLENDGGYTTVLVKQHSSVLHPATKLLQEYILDKKVIYDDNTLLEINFQNARCRRDTNLNMFVDKKKSTGKVDMVVSIIIAVYLIQVEYLLGDDDFVSQSA